MPTFDWECPQGHQFEAFVHFKSDGVDCLYCPERAVETIWTITKRNGGVQYPYVTKHITGQPIEIRDPGHERQVFKEHGVVRRDDAAWQLEEFGGYDFATKKQIYRRPSGAGMPGCWY